MLDIDAQRYGPLKRYVDSLGEPRKDRPELPFETLFSAELVGEAKKVVTAYGPLAEVEERRAKNRQEIEKAEAVLEETHFRAGELSHTILAATFRHDDLTAVLRPRIGGTPPEYVINLQDMSERLVANADALHERRVHVHLPEHLKHEEVSKQVVAHKTAVTRLEDLRRTRDGAQDTIENIRERADRVQKRINPVLKSYFGEERAEAVAHGLSERAAQPKRPKDKASPAPAPATVGGMTGE